MQQVLKDKNYSVEDYLTLEESGEVRHELINGNLYEMSGASRETQLTLPESFISF